MNLFQSEKSDFFGWLVTMEESTSSSSSSNLAAAAAALAWKRGGGRGVDDVNDFGVEEEKGVELTLIGEVGAQMGLSETELKRAVPFFCDHAEPQVRGSTGAMFGAVLGFPLYMDWNSREERVNVNGRLKSL